MTELTMFEALLIIFSGGLIAAGGYYLGVISGFSTGFRRGSEHMLNKVKELARK